MDQLALKYMMCKVESSTDSDSEISPRWSDTSTMGCVSSAPESGTLQTLQLTHKPAVKHGCYSLFLDPYDGSSEDSDESKVNMSDFSRRTRHRGKGGGCRFQGRNRRLIFHQPSSVGEAMKNGMRDPVEEFQHLSDIQRKCGTDSELGVCEFANPHVNCKREDCRDITEKTASDSQMHDQTIDLELDCQYDDSGMHAESSSRPQTPGPLTSVKGRPFLMLDTFSERSPRSLSKRKLCLPGADVVELGKRKRQCVVNMEQEGSISELN